MTELLVFITDADPVANATIGQVYLTTYPIHYIFHISENLPKNLKSKLCDQYNKFICDFFICHNSICEELFYKKWTGFIEKYSNMKDYLIRALYPDRRKSFFRSCDCRSDQ